MSRITIQSLIDKYGDKLEIEFITKGRYHSPHSPSIYREYTVTYDGAIIIKGLPINLKEVATRIENYHTWYTLYHAVREVNDFISETFGEVCTGLGKAFSEIGAELNKSYSKKPNQIQIKHEALELGIGRMYMIYLQEIGSDIKYYVGAVRNQSGRDFDYNLLYLNDRMSSKYIMNDFCHMIDVVDDVLRGIYGNGKTRIKRLKKAGFKPDIVQRAVNNYIESGYKSLLRYSDMCPRGDYRHSSRFLFDERQFRKMTKILEHMNLTAPLSVGDLR